MPLSLIELHAHDPHFSWEAGQTRRACCPLDDRCRSKRIDAAHRSLTVYPSGGYACARCKAKGLIAEMHTDRQEPDTPRARTRRHSASRAIPQTAFALVPPPPEKGDSPLGSPIPSARSLIAAMIPLAGTIGEKYVESRGISVEAAHVAGVRFCPDDHGCARVVFPIRDGHGLLRAVQGRSISPASSPAHRTVKLYEEARHEGVFSTRKALKAATIAVVEAPFDALSVAYATGIPAIATLGSRQMPTWFPRALALKHVLLAQDADEAGDTGAAETAAVLASHGTYCQRLRPEGAKDWNAVLATLGASALQESFRSCTKHSEMVFIPDVREVARSCAREASGEDQAIGGDGYRLLSINEKWRLCAAAGCASSPLLASLLNLRRQARRNGQETESCFLSERMVEMLALQAAIEREVLEESKGAGLGGQGFLCGGRDG